jgi:hypothetical protein
MANPDPQSPQRLSADRVKHAGLLDQAAHQSPAIALAVECGVDPEFQDLHHALRGCRRTPNRPADRAVFILQQNRLHE